MKLKRYLLLITIVFLVVCTFLCVAACNKTETPESPQDNNPQIVPPEGDDPLTPPETPAETYVLSFAGLTADENIVVTKGKVIGLLPKVPEKGSFQANGWKVGKDKITASTVWNYSSDKTAEPVYVSVTETAEYTVEHWMENLKTGEYENRKTEHKTGYIGTEVAGVAIYNNGYKKDLGYKDSKEVGTVEADGSLVLKLYYSLKKYTVNFITNNGDDWQPMEVKHGTLLANIPNPEPALAGLKFEGWFKYGEKFNLKTTPIIDDCTLEAEYSGTVTINTKEEFFSMQRYQSRFVTYQLKTDIMFNNSDFTRVETEVGTESVTWNRIAYIMESLNSVFDGQGHTISVTYDKTGIAEIYKKVEAYPALFHTIDADGVLKNVKIISNTLTNSEATSVARWNYGLVENCYIDATHVLQHEESKVPGPEPKEWFPSNTAEIVENYGIVRNCVFKIDVKHMDGTVFTNSYAVRHTYDGGTFENCTVIGDTSKQFISTDYANFAFFGPDPALTVGNKDSIRNNCYVFASVSDLLSGNGGKYNADGTITPGTYTNVKNLYTWFA